MFDPHSPIFKKWAGDGWEWMGITICIMKKTTQNHPPEKISGLKRTRTLPPEGGGAKKLVKTKVVQKTGCQSSTGPEPANPPLLGRALCSLSSLFTPLYHSSANFSSLISSFSSSTF